VPWAPELFSAPALARLEEEQQRELTTVPYYAGLLTGEVDALVEAFVGEPELHEPLRGRIRGEREFRVYVEFFNTWFEELQGSIEDVDGVIALERAVEEVVIDLRSGNGHIQVPAAVVAEKSRGRIEELRVYHSLWPMIGRHNHRPPVLQPDPDLREPEFVAAYQAALAAGDAEAIVDMFEPDGYAREPAGATHLHRGPEELRAFYRSLFSNGGGIPLEHCAITCDDRACALEYNVVRWGRSELQPEAGLAVYARGDGGKLAAARIYDDAESPLSPPG
jgi:hypothetical protein